MYSKRMESYPKGSAKRLELSRKIAMMRYRLKQVQHKYKYTKVNGRYMEIPLVIHETAQQIKEMYGTELRASLSPNKPNYGYTPLHYCFCKYLIEVGCKSRQVSFFMGTNRNAAASVARLRFTRTFKTNPDNKKTYHLFLRNTKQKS